MNTKDKIQLLKGLLNAATLLKKGTIMLENDGMRKTLPHSNLTYPMALERMIAELEEQLAQVSEVYGDDTIPNYSVPTKTFVKNNEYDAWCDFYYGEEWKILTLVGRTADTLYFKSGNTIIRGEVRVREWDGFDVEYTSLGWTENGKEYETVLYSADI